MNQAHYHLVLNHLPIIIPLVGLLVLTGGMAARLEIVKKTAYLIFILGALATIPTMLTGEGAEDIVKVIPGITKSLIYEHAQVAGTFAVASYLLGFMSLIIFWLKWGKDNFSKLIDWLLIVAVVAVLFFAIKTGTTGGNIRHTEIVENTTATDTTK